MSQVNYLSMIKLAITPHFKKLDSLSNHCFHHCSIIGAVSIIASAVGRKQIWSPKVDNNTQQILCLFICLFVCLFIYLFACLFVCLQVHPIFQLSVADFLLGVLWIVGGVLWFRGVPNKVWCFAVSLPTVVSVKFVCTH